MRTHGQNISTGALQNGSHLLPLRVARYVEPVTGRRMLLYGVPRVATA